MLDEWRDVEQVAPSQISWRIAQEKLNNKTVEPEMKTQVTHYKRETQTNRISRSYKTACEKCIDTKKL